MKIFVCWSGEKSRMVAELFRGWIQNVIQGTDVFLSTQSIEGGALWASEVADNIRDRNFGVAFITQENKRNTWIHFEAGGLFKGLGKARVVPLLVDLTTTDLEPPLSWFQAAQIDSESMLRLVKSINEGRDDRRISEDILMSSFTKWWSDFEKPFGAIAKASTSVAAKRQDRELLEELLAATKNLQGMVEKLSRDLTAAERSRVAFQNVTRFADLFTTPDSERATAHTDPALVRAILGLQSSEQEPQAPLGSRAEG